MSRSFFISVFFLCLWQVVFAQKTLVWTEMFNEGKKNWRTTKNGAGHVRYDNGKIIFSHADEQPLSVKADELYMDFADDYTLKFKVKMDAPITIFWNSSVDGNLGNKLRLSSTDFLVEEITDRTKQLSKGRIKSALDLSQPFDINIVHKKGEVSIAVSQDGPQEVLAKLKIPSKAKQFSIGLQSDLPPKTSSAIYELLGFSVEYFPYTLKGIVEKAYFGEKEWLTDSINTRQFHEHSPYITIDGGTLYLVRDSANTSKVYYSNKSEGSWQTAQLAPHPINIGGENSVLVSISEDGGIFFIRNTQPNGDQPENELISSATFDGADFIEKTIFTLPEFITQSKNATNFISISGDIVISSLENKANIGGKDLFASIRDEKGNLSKMINLGSSINSKGDEFHPYLAADNRTLYISSTGWPGYGEADIYMAKRLDDSWTKWSPLMNMGRSVNSFDWEGQFTVDAMGEYGYFASVDKESQTKDIYRILLPKGMGPEPLLVVSGYVRSSKTNEPLIAGVAYTDLDNELDRREVRTNRHGFYRIILPENKDYALFGHKESYYPKSDTVSLKQLEGYREVNIDLYLTPIEINTNINLSNIFFEQSKPDILPRSFAELNNLLATLRENPTMKIKIEGHTDSFGNRQMNINLSKARATAIKDYLVRKGIDSARIRAIGFGPDRPIADNTDPEARKLNRRVEFSVTER